jgi:hypothetical protein
MTVKKTLPKLSLFMLNEVLRNCYDSISLFLRLIVRLLKNSEQFSDRPVISLPFLGCLD